MNKGIEEINIVFDKKLITGLYRDEDSNYLIIRFPSSSSMKDYIWSIPIDRIVFNFSSRSTRGFNDNKCWMRAYPEEQLKAFRLNTKEASAGNHIEDIISLSPEEMKEYLKPSFEHEYESYLNSHMS